jgi:hypothetical protein
MGRISFLPKANPPTWNSNRKSILNSNRRDRASLQKTMSFTDAFIVAQKIGRNPRPSFCCMAAAIFWVTDMVSR